MEIEEALRKELVADANLFALVSDGISPDAATQSGAMPYITYHQASRRQERNLAGERINLNSYSLALEVSARTRAMAKLVYLALREAILDLRGPIGDGSVTVLGVTEDDGADRHSPPIHADAKGIYHADLDVTLGYGN